MKWKSCSAQVCGDVGVAQMFHPPSRPSCFQPKVLTLWKRREMLLVNARAAISQWILKTLYLAGGQGEGEEHDCGGDGGTEGGWQRRRVRALRVLAEH
jgi:hypothetical protein